ncbi:hypothetical protein D9M68_829030 [compost metagenome]
MQAVGLAGHQLPENLQEPQCHQGVADGHDDEHFPALDGHVFEFDANVHHLAHIGGRSDQDEAHVQEAQQHHQDRRHLACARGHQLHQRVHANVRTDAHPVRDADEDHEREHHAGHLQRPGEAGVEGVPHHHLGEGQRGHAEQHQGDQPLLKAVKNFHG